MTAQVSNTILTGTLGACWGSFLNSAYYREENHLSLSSPPSHCPNCKNRIPPCLNVPVLGWAFTGGKCFNCKKPVSLHYPATELLVALTFIGCLAITSLPFAACCLGALVTLCILGAIFDHRHFIIPNVTIIGAMLFTAALVIGCPQVLNPNVKNDSTARVMLLGGGAGMMLLLLVIKHAGELFFRRIEKFGGKMIINEKGVKSIHPNGEEFFTAWDDFCYSKVVPRGGVKVFKARSLSAENIPSEPAERRDDAMIAVADGCAPVEMANDDIIVRDEEVIVLGKKADLSQGVELGAEQLYICRSVMGMGDIKLSASLGALIGLNAGLVEMLFFACCTGTVHGLYLRRKDRRLPFAPHLMLATAYVIASRHGIVPHVRTLLYALGSH